MPLLDLPHDVAPSLSTLLDGADLNALTSVSSAARRSLFLSICDTRRAALVLPPLDQDRTQTLLRGLDPVRITRFQWIQVANPWHIDLLVECGLVEFVQSVRVEMVDMNDSATMAQICEKLPLLTSVTKLSVIGAALMDVTPLSRMLQLRDLVLSQTKVRDVSSLAALTKLESLCSQFGFATDWSCIQKMAELKVLKIAGITIKPRIPSLTSLTKLRTVNVMRAIISADDLLAVTALLDHLQLHLVSVECAERLLEDQQGLNEELTHNLSQLRAIAAPRNSTMFCYQLTTLSRRSGLDVTSFTVTSNEDMETLKRLPHLDSLLLKLYFEGGPVEQRLHPDVRDFSPFLGLAQLSRLDIKFIAMHSSHGRAAAGYFRVGRALGDVIRQLAQLKHISLDGIVDPATTLSGLSLLEHLELGINCSPFLTTFDWISSHQGLRTLKITCSLRGCDLSDIASLARLEHLQLIGSDTSCGEAATTLSFLAKLTNVKSLVLDVDHVHDFVIFREMRSLESLTIRFLCATAKTTNLETLAALPRLRKLDIQKTSITNVAALARFPSLRSVVLPSEADCSPLVTCGHPTLLKIVHGSFKENCLWTCEKRNSRHGCCV